MNVVDPMQNIKVEDSDTDSMAILPLAILLFESVTLRGLLMIKNLRMQSVVQMFRDQSAGSGHIAPSDIKDSIGEINSTDTDIINRVANLHSFDVYCLRISLRELGIQVNDTKYLKLSPSMQAELEVYVRPFTAKLIQAIYGSDADVSGEVDVTKLFNDADPQKTKEKLTHIANSLQINLAKVPQFLEDYGDIYLSIAYYRNRLEQLEPSIDEFLAAMRAISSNQHLKSNPEIAATATKIATRVQKMHSVLHERFDHFAKSTEDMWNDMSAEKFADFKVMVEANHGAIGGLLCKLGVKIDAWDEKFPSRHTVGPNRLADFLMTEIRQGF